MRVTSARIFVIAVVRVIGLWLLCLCHALIVCASHSTLCLFHPLSHCTVAPLPPQKNNDTHTHSHQVVTAPITAFVGFIVDLIVGMFLWPKRLTVGPFWGVRQRGFGGAGVEGPSILWGGRAGHVPVTHSGCLGGGVEGLNVVLGRCRGQRVVWGRGRLGGGAERGLVGGLGTGTFVG